MASADGASDRFRHRAVLAVVLGLFDSGLGGLTVLRQLRERMPDADVLFFADQKHMPYGDRAPEDLMELMRNNVAWLNEQGVDAIVMACNTSCATASVHGWPSSQAPIYDLIDAAAEAVGKGGFDKIGVFATVATVRAGAYTRAITKAEADVAVTEIAAPALVPLIERPQASEMEIDAAVAAICDRLPRDVDAIVYGCTHYPLVDDSFVRALGERIARIDPAVEQAERVSRVARASGLPGGRGATRFVTTGDLEAFRTRVGEASGRTFERAQDYTRM